MKPEIPVGTVFTKEMVVKEEHLATTFGSGRVKVFSTPYMVTFVEGTCNEGMMGYHDDTHASVGAVVNINHLRPTPLGMKVRCEAVYMGQDEKNLYTFEAKVFDEKELVGTCLHKRGFIHIEKFTSKAYSKKAE